MLDQDTLNQLKAYTEKIVTSVKIKLFEGKHEQRPELISLLEPIASLSPKIELIEGLTTPEGLVNNGLSFEISGDKREGVYFAGIPGGHEFNSFILALLQAGGHSIKLDEGVQKQISAINGQIHFESVVSLDCHVCPDVVQILNQIALLNPKISHCMIEGAKHEAYLSDKNVQGVPTVFLNGEPFSSGQIGLSEILEKIQEKFEISNATIDEDNTLYDVAIVGGGPSAVSAAIYTARKGLSVIMIGDKPGGQVADTVGIENLISVKQTTGKQLSANLYEHLSDYPVKSREGILVESIKKSENFELLLSTSEKLTAKTVIIATGAQWRKLNVPGEKENVGRGVAYCPHCDGPFFKGKDVIVVGGGNSGIEAALDLAGITKSVTVLEFMEELKADKVLVDKAHSTKNISIYTSVESKNVESNDAGVTGLKILDRISGEEKLIKTDGIFVQIGLAPNSGFLGDLVDRNNRAEIVVNPKCETSVPGIFACGDVTDVPYKQIIVSMGEGAKAGLSAFEYLLTNQPVSA